MTAPVHVAFAIPVAQTDITQANETFKKWKAMGYYTMALFDGDDWPREADCVVRSPRYRGWAHAVNALCGQLVSCGMHWVVTGGADVWPDPNKLASEIGRECVEHFGGTLGVMQPSGDRYGALSDYSACVSPWLGREWIERAYQGRGALFAGYQHYYADTELMHVARACRALWFRDDINQYHNHYLRLGQPTPPHLQLWQAKVAESSDLFMTRRREGFPGSGLANVI